MIFFWLIPWTLIGVVAYWGVYYAITKKRPEDRDDALMHHKR